MNRTLYYASLVSLTLLGACASEPAQKGASVQTASAQAAEIPAEAAPKMARPEASWVKERAEASAARLEAAGEGGQMIARAIEAHGGLERWYGAGPLAFRFRYEPVDGAKVRDTVQVVDTWSARAVHHAPDDESKRFGWDGQKAWRTYEDETIKPRFWSLTPFYFTAMPFVLADEGVNLKAEGEAEFEGKTYDLVRATFAPGTGDAPDDFYVVYLDRDHARVAGVRYVVTYPGFFPEGGSTPEKFMKYDGAQTVSGITLPESFRTFSWDAEQGRPIEVVTNTTLSEVSFRPELEDSFFAAPDGAGVEVLDGM